MVGGLAAILAVSRGAFAPIVLAFIAFALWLGPTTLKDKVQKANSKKRGIIIDVKNRTVTSQ
ncbi:hypothetical protein R4Z09_26135 [Niallia oryzisoli]|uniref:Uncharacterized protein n=1 Tax=Niallia oryzisoli TaxID=1737571 RepID=A0ABZ2CBM1_9BACI